MLQRGDIEVKKTTKQKTKQFLWIFFVCFLAAGVVHYRGNGLPLFGLPDQVDIISVTISDTRLSGTERQVTDANQILTARNVANLLNYKLGDTKGCEEPFITITYHLANGEDQVVQASSEMVIWQSKTHLLKDGSMFVKIVEVLYFGDLLEE